MPNGEGLSVNRREEEELDRKQVASAGIREEGRLDRQ